jgi:hypothetical protein
LVHKPEIDLTAPASGLFMSRNDATNSFGVKKLETLRRRGVA